MPSKTVTTSPTLIYQSAHGTKQMPTRLIAQPQDSGESVAFGTGRLATLTYANGILTATGDAFQDDEMLQGDAWYAIATSGTVTVNYDIQGSL